MEHITEPVYELLPVNTALIEIPRDSYQRELNPTRVAKIVAEFDERLANDPKVSHRDGRYYVFDGQHTIAARKQLNGGKDLPIRCKVFRGLTEATEAKLFAQQTGVSAQLTAGAKIRALIVAGDPNAVAFKKSNEKCGVNLDYEQDRGKFRIACTSTAFTEFLKVGAECYEDALNILIEAWDGAPDSFRKENLMGLTRFLDLYDGEYKRKRLITQLRKSDPLTIYREGKATGINLCGYKKYLYQVYRIYNGSSKVNALPLKF